LEHVNKQSGFSLIAVALLILVLGLIAVPALQIIQVKQEKQRIDVTAQKLASLKNALRVFRSRNGRLPCPAPLDASLDSATFGLEVTPDCTDGDYAGTFRAPGRDGRMVRTGAVPVRTLNVADELAVDKWGHRIVYAVTEAYAAPGAPFEEDKGAITVLDTNGNDVTSAPGNLAYVLVAQRQDARGAYGTNGRLLEPCEAGSAAGANCTYDASFVNTLARSSSPGGDQITHTVAYGDMRTPTPSACEEETSDENELVGNFCMLSFTDFTVGGTGSLNGNSCGIAANASMDMSGTLSINVSDLFISDDLTKSGTGSINVEDLYIGGDSTESGTGDISAINYDALETGRPPVPDPYADLDVPEYDSCAAHCSTQAQRDAGVADGTIASVDPINISGTSSHSFGPGVYCEVVSLSGTGPKTISSGTYCDGLSISGTGAVTFNPGTYVMDGGDFTKSGTGSLNGSGVSVVLTSSSGNGADVGNMEIGANTGNLNLTAPGEGQPMAGVLFYQDRIASSGSCNSYSGTGSSNTDGAFYFPSRCLEWGGTGGSSCTRIIAYEITKNGTGGLGNNCGGVPVRNIGWSDSSGDPVCP
jgi:type II secretory pathway pseudopilin PulG|tara:strand:+ start:3088 stop:4851 length:1764 start_codon:yes stop_codon:yes gene_type:complete